MQLLLTALTLWEQDPSRSVEAIEEGPSARDEEDGKPAKKVKKEKKVSLPSH